MIRTILVGAAALLVAAGAVATAHEQGLHKGRATSGRIVSLSERGLVLETASGNVSVTLSEATKFERDDKPVPRQEVRNGDHVQVFGTKLETGELVAREIIAHGSEAGPGHGGGTAHHGQ